MFFIKRREWVTMNWLYEGTQSATEQRTKGTKKNNLEKEKKSPTPLGLGVRVTRQFRVGFFGFSEFRVLKNSTRGSPETRESHIEKRRVMSRSHSKVPLASPTRSRTRRRLHLQGRKQGGARKLACILLLTSFPSAVAEEQASAPLPRNT
jgi:hypothetical protein